MSGHQGVGGIGHEKQYTFFAVAGQSGKIGRKAVDRRVIDFEVTGVDDRARRRPDGETERVDDGMRDSNGFQAKWSGLDDIARLENPQLDGTNGELLELVSKKAERERHPVNGNRHAFDEEWKRADVIFVCVSEEDCLQARGILEEVGHIGNDDVHSEGRGIGEHHSAIEGDRRVAVFHDHEIHPDLAEAAQRHDA